MKTFEYLTNIIPQTIYSNGVLTEYINLKEDAENLTIEFSVNESCYKPSLYPNRIFVCYYDLMYAKQVAHIVSNYYQNDERFEIPNSAQNENFDVSVQPILLDDEKFNDILQFSDYDYLSLEDSLFIHACLFITYHEIGHFIKDLEKDMNGECIAKSKYDQEVNADNVAFDAIKEGINTSNNEQKKELITIGTIIGIGFILFANKNIDVDTDHPHPVKRLKSFFETIQSANEEDYKLACHIIECWAIINQKLLPKQTGRDLSWNVRFAMLCQSYI